MLAAPRRVLDCLLTGVFGALLTLGLLAPAASAEPPPPPPAVSIVAESSSVRVSETIHLTATATSDVGPTPYSIRIFDADSHTQVTACGSGTVCHAEVSIGWSENPHPSDRHYYAEVSAASEGYEHTTSGTVTVGVEKYVFPVTLTSEPSSVQVPDSFTLKATTNLNVGPTPYSIRIIEDGTNTQVGACGSGTECTTTVNTSWSENGASHSRSFHALISSAEYVAGESSDLSVGIDGYAFSVSLSASPSSVEATESFSLKASTSRDVGPTPYSLRIIENGTESTVASCGSGTECSGTVTTSWSENGAPHSRTFRAVVSSASYTAGESANATVSVVPFPFAVGLTLTYDHTSEGDIQWYKAKATTNRDVGPTPYHIAIIRDGTTGVAWCGSGTECSAEVEGGHSYVAVVRNSSEQTFGSSSVADLDAAGLAALFPTASAVCDALLTYTGTHLAGSSLSDQYLACETAVRAAGAGATVAIVIAAVERTDEGGRAIWWLLHEGTVNQPEFELPAPSETDPYPVPSELPQVWPVERVAEALISANPAAELTEDQAETIARRCLWYEAVIDADGVDLCEHRPIFSSGSDVPEATIHDLKAIATNPRWVNLNYESSEAKKVKVPNRKWYEAEAACAEVSPGQQCDEYPFYATQQGGPGQEPPTSLEVIDALDNEEQGRKYGSFVLSCKMAERGSTDYAFLAIPTPPSLEIPTQIRLCNGNP